jgi:hypothetical protein
MQTLLSTDPVAFPNSLPESHCISVNVCSEMNSRGQSFPRQTWIHRSEDRFEIDNEDYGNIHYNFYSIEYARVPEGVLLRACQPNFDHLRVHGEYICNVDLKATVSVSGVCPLSGSQDVEDILECVAPLQFDATEATGSFLGQDDVVYPVAALYGSTQMIYYDFADGWGCFDSAHITPGVRLSSVQTPNRILDCPELENGHYTNECSFVCDTNFVAVGETCEPVCTPDVEPLCVHGHFASTICSDHHPHMFICEPCPRINGSGVLPWNELNPGACEYEDCVAGSYDFNGICTLCPIDTYSNAVKSTSCEECAYGFYAPLGSHSCTECFSDSVVDTPCDPGHVVSRNLTEIDQYFSGVASTFGAYKYVSDWCHAKYACLSCPPGTHEVNGQCQECAVGMYQPNFMQTVCFECGASMTTHGTGKIESSDCVCDEGFE